VLFIAAENARVAFMDSSGLIFERGIRHVISRSNIYEDVIKLYSSSTNDILKERPFRVRFSGEKAFDIGGVSRDMFAAFYEKAYVQLFDGPSMLTPIDHPDFSTSPLPVFGTIMSHAYFVAGTLPVKIAFPSLCAMLLGNPSSIPREVLFQSFIESLDHHEASMVKKASLVARSADTDTQFPEDLRAGLIEVYSRFGVRQIPKPGNFSKLIIDIAKFYFLRKPAAAIDEVKSGIPCVHAPFWKNLSTGELYGIFRALQATPAKVLALLENVKGSNQSQERVFNYLRQYVGNMQQDELHNFLRFVTGSSVCSSTVISVVFNALDGLARRPIGHTCSRTLELSTSYASYLDLVQEFRAVLSSEYSWEMDAV
jgi:hypothetical protein